MLSFNKANKTKREQIYLKYIEPLIEKIIKDIIDSRIKNNNEKDRLFIQYKTSDNKLIDLIKMQNNNKENTHIFEFNIYFLFKRGSIAFIVEHWKFKIDSTPSESNALNEDRIKRKLLTFYRSIKSLEKILPLNGMVKNSFDYSFSAQLYLQSNIEISVEEQIKKEKKDFVLDAKDEKYGSIQLTLNYLTNYGIQTHEDNTKEFISKDFYTKFYTKLSQDKKEKSKMSKIPQNIQDTNKDIFSNEKNIYNGGGPNDDDDDIDLSRMCEEAEGKELLISSIIDSKIIDKRGNLEKEDIQEIENIKKIGSREHINADELYNSCFENLEDINCQKSLDEILNKNNLMKKENDKLNEIKNKYQCLLFNNKSLVEELYEEMNDFNYKDLIIEHPKMNKEKNILIISNYFGYRDDNKKMKKEGKQSEQELFNDMISDYIEIKQLLK